MSKDIEMTPQNRHVLLTKDQADLIAACLDRLTVPEAHSLAQFIRRQFMPDVGPAVRDVTEEEARHLFGFPPLPEIKSEGW